MPPKCKFTREQIVQAALDITREQGIEAVTARSVGARLDSSPKVIFSLFRNMEELTAGVLGAAHGLYQRFLEEDMASGKYPPYKGSGMGYIRFAREEPQLFRLLFMRDRTHEQITDGKEEMRSILALIEQSTGLCPDDAYLFHLEMWLYVHGIAAMIATSYLDWEMDFVSRVLTDAYLGLKARFGIGKSGAGREEQTEGGAQDGRDQNDSADEAVSRADRR